MKNKNCQPDKKPLSTVQKAAQLMNKNAQFVRVGLQRGVLPIGTAIQSDSGQWNYYISPKLFKDFTGKDLEAEF